MLPTSLPSGAFIAFFAKSLILIFSGWQETIPQKKQRVGGATQLSFHQVTI